MALSAYQTATGIDPEAEQQKYMSVQSPTGSSTAYVPPPTMSPAGPVLQAPKAADLTPSIPTSGATVQPASTSSSTPAPTAAPAQAPTTVAPGSTAPASSAANLAIAAPTAQALSFDQTIAKQPVGGASAPQIGVPSGPTDLMGRPIGPSGVYEPFSSPEFTLGAGGQVGTFKQPDGTWTNADGSPLAAGTDQWGRSTMTGTGMQPSSTNGVTNPAAGAPARSIAPTSPNVNLIPAPTAQQLAPNAGAPGTTAGTTSAAGVSTRALTGAEQPYRVDPTQSSALQALIAKLSGEATRQLDQPTIWDDALAGTIKDQQRRGIDENYTAEGDSLNAELADRGINWSSIAGNRLTGLATRKAQALSDVDTNIARERANALAAGRASAFGNASGLAGTQFGMEQTLQNAERGERDTTQATQQQAWQNAMQEALAQHGMTMDDQAAWQAAINSGLNYGTGTAGTSALNAASGINSETGQQYGEQAAASNAGMQQLAEYAMKFYGGGQ